MVPQNSKWMVYKWKTLLKWMIWVEKPYFWKHPYDNFHLLPSFLHKSQLRGSLPPKPKTKALDLKKSTGTLNTKLVGGFKPFEKYARQIVSFPQGSG